MAKGDGEPYRFVWLLRCLPTSGQIGKGLPWWKSCDVNMLMREDIDAASFYPRATGSDQVRGRERGRELDTVSSCSPHPTGPGLRDGCR